MRFRFSTAALALASLVTGVSMASAADAYVRGSVVLRSGPGTAYEAMTIIPKRSKVRVYHCSGWCEVSYGPYRGYASAAFVTVGKKHFADFMTITPIRRLGDNAFRPIYVPPQPAYLSSQYQRCPSAPAMRVFYYDGRYADRPDHFLMVTR